MGLEQVARDQRNNASPFKDLFTGAEYKLRAVLCEIQVIIFNEFVFAILFAQLANVVYLIISPIRFMSDLVHFQIFLKFCLWVFH